MAVFSPLMLIAVFAASFELALEGESADVGSTILIFGSAAMAARLAMMLVGTARLVEVQTKTDICKHIPQPQPDPTLDEAVMAEPRRRLVAELPGAQDDT